MTWTGWLFMGTSWALILAVLAYTMGRTLRSGGEAAVPGHQDPPSTGEP